MEPKYIRLTKPELLWGKGERRGRVPLSPFPVAQTTGQGDSVIFPTKRFPSPKINSRKPESR